MAKELIDISVKAVAVTLSSSDIQNLFDTPKVLIPAPGAGKLILPLMAAGDYQCDVPYENTEGGNLSFGYEDYGALEPMSPGDLFLQTESKMFTDAITGSWASTNAINEAFVLMDTAANYTAGNGTAVIRVVYVIVDVA